jgi:hypothetical protein
MAFDELKVILITEEDIIYDFKSNLTTELELSTVGCGQRSEEDL